jgi:hypothetical protein
MKNNILLFISLSLIFASCSKLEQVEVSDNSTTGHLDAFIKKSKNATGEIKSSGVDIENTTKLALAMEQFKNSHPDEYKAIEGETNGWEIAKKLKRSKAFAGISSDYGLDIKSIHYIEREGI